MSIFQKAAIALARSPGAGRLMRATAAGSALASRFVGGATPGRRRRPPRACASVTASAPRCSIWVNTSPTPPSSNRPSGRPSPPAARWRRRAWTCMCRLIPPPSATRTATRWAATMRGASRRRRGGRRRGATAVLDMEDDGIRERTCALHRELLDDGLPAGLTLQARRLRTLPDLEWAVRQRTRCAWSRGLPGARAGPSRRARIDAAYLEAAAIMLSPQARAAGFCRCSAPMTIGWPARSWPWRANGLGARRVRVRDAVRRAHRLAAGPARDGL